MRPKENMRHSSPPSCRSPGESLLTPCQFYTSTATPANAQHGWDQRLCHTRPFFFLLSSKTIGIFLWLYLHICLPLNNYVEFHNVNTSLCKQPWTCMLCVLRPRLPSVNHTLLPVNPLCFLLIGFFQCTHSPFWSAQDIISPVHCPSLLILLLNAWSLNLRYN